MSERMERKKQQKRTAILDRAERLIAKKGYLDMTIDEIAADADVAKGTVYLYFNSKEAICAAVVARVIADMNASMREGLAGLDGGTERIKAIGNLALEWRRSHPEQSKVLDSVMAMTFKDPADENVQELIRIDGEQLELIVHNFKLSVEDGSLRPDLDLLSTALFMRMAISAAINPFPYHALVIDAHGVDRALFIRNAMELMLYATHKDANILISGIGSGR